MAAILVVDDDQFIRKFISSYLKIAGYQVLTASNGLEGLAVFRSNSGLIDLVITDLKMPKMGGYEMAVQIREINPKIKVICMSGFAEGKYPECLRILAKPFSIAQLRTHVDEVLSLAE